MILITFLAGGTIGLCIMAIFNGVSYDKGFVDGMQFEERKRIRDEVWLDE